MGDRPGRPQGAASFAYTPKCGNANNIASCAGAISIGTRWRPYRVECTGSRPTSEVMRRKARLVLGGGGRPGRSQGAANFAYAPKWNTSNHSKLCGCHIHWNSLAAIPRRMHRTSPDLRRQAAQGPVRTAVGDCPGRPHGAANLPNRNANRATAQHTHTNNQDGSTPAPKPTNRKQTPTTTRPRKPPEQHCAQDLARI